MKSGIYYFVRRVPKHLSDHYITNKISFSLRAKSEFLAKKRAQKFAEQLDDHWFAMGVDNDPTFSRYLSVAIPTPTGATLRRPYISPSRLVGLCVLYRASSNMILRSLDERD
ncbi:DUF6538 domain-containing protein [Aliiroseovarius salicola]|uniref:DUF6538 domain-containing protein n=1 Tax=Aliiroseovarius salicola TaxID=3009082 RepID=UPI0038CC0DF5